ncbi:zinc finger protein 182-like isoform X1 [Periophthalmus magnuspinnatus]|uniref:zinc finger protein 182-like isoform X1 n=1 Tax=Periophthalmus magnuspinnatus TaxID=409849 RepID=UPI0024373B48|nr:zinc finger protein 182-like isoform X1 [Periophthalmus magnuspinnatus]
MSYKHQALRNLVVERLAVAADEIFALFERTFAEYEEEVLRSKLLQETRVELTGSVAQLSSASPDVRQSPEQAEKEATLCIKKEEEPSVEFPFTPPPLKSEEHIDKSAFLQEEQLGEEKRHKPIEEQYEGEEPGCSLDLKSQNNEKSYSCSDTDDSENWEPSTKRSTKSDGQDSDLVLIEDSNTDVSLVKREEETPGCGSDLMNLQPKSGTKTSDGSSDSSSELESSDPKKTETKTKVQKSKRDRKKLDPKQLKCSECGKQFKRPAYLRKHMLYHSDPFSCDICSKTFRFKSQLNTHLRIHTQEKPFSCSVCKQRFSQKYFLTRHMKNHSDEKPFSCPECGLQFRQQYNVSRHIAAVHRGEKPFSCPVCKKAFAQKQDCTTHVSLHSKEKPFICSVCGKGFGDNGYLRRHEHKHKTREKKQNLIYCNISN